MLSKLSCSNYIPSGVRLLRVSSFTTVVSGKDISQMEIRRIVCVLPNSKNSLMWKQLLKKCGELSIAGCVTEELDNQLFRGCFNLDSCKEQQLGLTGLYGLFQFHGTMILFYVLGSYDELAYMVHLGKLYSTPKQNYFKQNCYKAVRLEL